MHYRIDIDQIIIVTLPLVPIKRSGGIDESLSRKCLTKVRHMFGKI